MEIKTDLNLPETILYFEEPLMRAGSLAVYPICESQVDQLARMRASADLEEQFVSASLTKHLNITYEDFYQYYSAYFAAAMSIKSLFAIVESDNHSTLAGGFAVLPPGANLQFEVPAKLEYMEVLLHQGHEIVHNSGINTKNYAYMGAFVVAREYRRGKVSTPSTWQALLNFAAQAKGYQGALSFLIAPQLLPVTQQAGATLLGSIYFDEFTVKGVKVFEDVEPNRFYLGGRPAVYVIAFNFIEQAKL